MNTNNVLSHQWASRPNDQRFLSIDELHAAVSARRQTSKVSDVALEHVRVRPTDRGDMTLGAVTGEDMGTMTNWAFGQLCTRAHAPAGYLRTLPAELAAVSLQWSLEHSVGGDGESSDAKVLSWAHSRTGARKSAAVTSPTYGRIWDADLTAAIKGRIDPTVWKIPGASYASKDPKRATTLYASDRDVFLFLCDETHAIEVPGEGPKFRGFYAYNSEVGNSKLGLAVMLYDRVCDNRIIWGVSGFKEITVRHTSGGPMRYMAEVVPQLRRYLEAAPSAEVDVIKAAQERIVGKDRAAVVDWLRSRGFAQTTAGRAYDAAEREGIRNPRSLWGVVSGLTDIAHEINYTDARVDLERKASALLDLAA